MLPLSRVWRKYLNTYCDKYVAQEFIFDYFEVQRDAHALVSKGSVTL